MRIALWTGAVLVLLVFAYIGWMSLLSDAPIEPQLAENRGKLADGEWYDPVVGTRVGLFNPTQVLQIGTAEANELESLGYLQGYEPAKKLEGVVAHDPSRAQPGYNLYVSAHAPEAYLMTMEGEILHTWRYEFRDACPDEVAEVNFGRRWFRRAKLKMFQAINRMRFRITRIFYGDQGIFVRVGGFDEELLGRDGVAALLEGHDGVLHGDVHGLAEDHCA